jgi:hypothetical protein
MREQSELRERVGRLRCLLWGVAGVAVALWAWSIFLSTYAVAIFSGWSGFF